MDAATLLELAKDYRTWLRKSADLRTSAAALWDAYQAAAQEWAHTQGHDDTAADAAWTRAMAHLTAAKLLYGYALETAFKAIILRDSPDEVEFTLRADGTGQVWEAELTKLGVPMKSGHDLVKLADSARVLRHGPDSVFTDPADLKAARQILDDLGAFTVWIARYPTPLRPAGRPGLNSPAMGDEMRRWTDPLLDYCHH